jgi:flagellar hook protein FlgE
MDIALNAAASGMQAAITRQDVTANNIANAVTPGYQQMNARQTEMSPAGTRISDVTRTPNPNPTTSGTQLDQQMVNLNLNKYDLSANAKVVKVQDTMIGEAIDLIA